MDEVGARDAGEDLREGLPVGVRQHEGQLVVEIVRVLGQPRVPQEGGRHVEAGEALDELRELPAQHVGLLVGVLRHPQPAADGAPVAPARRRLLHVDAARRRGLEPPDRDQRVGDAAGILGKHVLEVVAERGRLDEERRVRVPDVELEPGSRLRGEVEILHREAGVHAEMRQQLHEERGAGPARAGNHDMLLQLGPALAALLPLRIRATVSAAAARARAAAAGTPARPLFGRAGILYIGAGAAVFRGCRGIAQSGSAPGLGPGGRKFESCCPDHCRSAAERPVPEALEDRIP